MGCIDKCQISEVSLQKLEFFVIMGHIKDIARLCATAGPSGEKISAFS